MEMALARKNAACEMALVYGRRGPGKYFGVSRCPGSALHILQRLNGVLE